ncbi:hypothetical protein JXO52_10325 [bacterium]|nr:hypothetical protein [bacterium]
MDMNADTCPEERHRNCWEVKNCPYSWNGSDPVSRAHCPASIPGKLDGLNNGTYGGRACWAVRGTLCGGEVQGDIVEKLSSCLECDFLMQVYEEEGKNIILIPTGF